MHTDINIFELLKKTKNRFVLVLIATKVIKKIPPHIVSMLNRENTKLASYALRLIQEDKVKIIEEK